jgi:hypothetical protein
MLQVGPKLNKLGSTLELGESKSLAKEDKVALIAFE